MSWNMTRTYRLRALTSTSADLDVEGAFSAPSQVLSTEPNRSTRLRSGSGHVIGQMHVPLQGMVATGSSHATTEVELSVVNRRLRLSSLLRSESFTDVRKLGDAAVPATDAASTTTPPSEPPQPLAPAPASVPAPP